MGAPCSLDLRKRVVARIEACDSCRAVAARFGVAVSSVVKWAQRKRETSSVASRRMGGHRPFALAGQRAWLLARLAEKPDLTLRAVLAELADRGGVVSYYAVWNFFRHEGKAVRRAIRAAGAKLLFLPAYSPDLNLIEQVFAKLKTLLRKGEERTVEATWKHIGQLLDRFTPTECANYLRNAGYASA